uniref:CSON001539 protein n=1 Tax=Culicoides sonorensis TaxID=179676 RepID=A0A336KYM1_CULSO
MAFWVTKQTTKMCGLTNEENSIRLRQALKDKAKERVVSQLSIPSLVPQIIKTLQMIYGRPEQILHLQINKIRNEPALKNDKLESLIDFSVMVNNLCATMEASDLFKHLNSPLLLQELVDKLPPNLKLEWAAFRVRTPTINLISFQEWLSEIAERACTVMPLKHVDTNQKSTKNNYHMNFHEEDNQKSLPKYDKKCLICHGN